MTGALLTPRRIHKGDPERAMCHHCGALDTDTHRICACPRWSTTRSPVSHILQYDDVTLHLLGIPPIGHKLTQLDILLLHQHLVAVARDITGGGQCYDMENGAGEESEAQVETSHIAQAPTSDGRSESSLMRRQPKSCSAKHGGRLTRAQDKVGGMTTGGGRDRKRKAAMLKDDPAPPLPTQLQHAQANTERSAWGYVHEGWWGKRGSFGVPVA